MCLACEINRNAAHGPAGTVSTGSPFFSTEITSGAPVQVNVSWFPVPASFLSPIFNSTPSRLLESTFSVYDIFGEVVPGGYKVSFMRENVLSDCKNALDGGTGAIGLATY